MEFLKRNWLTIVLSIALAGCFWRMDKLSTSKRLSDSEALKSFVIEHLSEVKKELQEQQTKSLADSIQRNEVLKSLPKYENNLSHLRLLAIRDSLRKFAK